MKLRQLVSKTLKDSGGNVNNTDRIVTSLITAGYTHDVTGGQISKIKDIVQSQISVIASLKSPLHMVKASSSNECPYCHKPFKRMKIGGDALKEAHVCLEDRIVLPIEV